MGKQENPDERRTEMPDPHDRLRTLEEQMAALQTRLAALEDLVSSQRQDQATSAFPFAEATSDHESPLPQTGTVQGTVRYAGSIQIGERPFRFQQTLTVASLFEAEPSLM